MTSASTVTPGQASAKIPTMMARTPSRINEVDVDLNITDIPFFRLHRAAPFGPPRVPTPLDAKIAMPANRCHQ
jgi:hypothetical protein